jgi:hypothetical protein
MMLKVGAGVGIDFQTDGNLDDPRCFPSHGGTPFRWRSNDGWNCESVSRHDHRHCRDARLKVEREGNFVGVVADGDCRCGWHCVELCANFGDGLRDQAAAAWA